MTNGMVLALNLYYMKKQINRRKKLNTLKGTVKAKIASSSCVEIPYF